MPPIGYDTYSDYVQAGKPRNTPDKPKDPCPNCGGDFEPASLKGPYVTSWKCENDCEPVEEDF